MDKDYNIFDGAHVEMNCTDINRAQFSYNNGVFLLGAAYMYNFVSFLMIAIESRNLMSVLIDWRRQMARTGQRPSERHIPGFLPQRHRVRGSLRAAYDLHHGYVEFQRIRPQMDGNHDKDCSLYSFHDPPRSSEIGTSRRQAVYRRH